MVIHYHISLFFFFSFRLHITPFFFLLLHHCLVLEEANLDVLVLLLQLVSKLESKSGVLHCEGVEPGGCPELQLDDDLLALTSLDLLHTELRGIGLLAEGGKLVERGH